MCRFEQIRFDAQMFVATAMHLKSQYLDSENNGGPSKDDCRHWLASMSACGAFGLGEMCTKSNYVGSEGLFQFGEVVVVPVHCRNLEGKQAPEAGHHSDWSVVRC